MNQHAMLQEWRPNSALHRHAAVAVPRAEALENGARSRRLPGAPVMATPLGGPTKRRQAEWSELPQARAKMRHQPGAASGGRDEVA